MELQEDVGTCKFWERISVCWCISYLISFGVASKTNWLQLWQKSQVDVNGLHINTSLDGNHRGLEKYL